MTRYNKYIRVALSTVVEKRKGCKHPELFDDIIYRKCKCCGAFKPFRSQEDIDYRGLIGEGDDFKKPLIRVVLDEVQCNETTDETSFF